MMETRKWLRAHGVAVTLSDYHIHGVCPVKNDEEGHGSGNAGPGGGGPTSYLPVVPR
jgi:hypothetical protein